MEHVTYNDIHEAHFKIKTNAGFSESDLGGGVNGLLGLVMPPDL